MRSERMFLNGFTAEIALLCEIITRSYGSHDRLTIYTTFFSQREIIKAGLCSVITESELD